MWRKYHFLVVLVIALLTIPLLAYADADRSDFQLKTVYHVQIDGNEIGTVTNKEMVEKALEKKVAKFKEQHAHLSYAAPKATFQKERGFGLKPDDEAVLKWIDKHVHIKANAVAIAFGEHGVYVESNEAADEVINRLKEKYTNGNAKILEVTFSVEPKVEKHSVEPEKVLSIDNAVNYITKGTLQEKVHQVREGEVLSTIAEKYGLSTKELVALNPGVTIDSLLQIGQELKVTAYKPLVDVVIKEEVLTTEVIPYEIETINDENRYKGDIITKQEGQKGEKNVLYHITKTNGQITGKAVVKETIIKQPVKKIVIRGTKVISSRGSGKFVWPTVGGYVSSRMGYRWGSFHKGTDIAGASGSPILAADNGTVTFAGWDGGYGKKIVVNHNNGYTTVYAHLSSIHVKPGQTVVRGQKIGIMGSTGHSTGVHLHIELYKNGRLVDFLNYVR